MGDKKLYRFLVAELLKNRVHLFTGYYGTFYTEKNTLEEKNGIPSAA